MYYDIEKSGSRIAMLRKNKGISQSKLADKIGIHCKTVSKAERGVNGLSVDYLMIVAEYFGVSMEYLIGAEESVDTLANELFRRCPDDRKNLLLNVMRVFVEKGA